MSSAVDSGIDGLLGQVNTGVSNSNMILTVLLFAVCMIIGIEIARAFSFWKW